MTEASVKTGVGLVRLEFGDHQPLTLSDVAGRFARLDGVWRSAGILAAVAHTPDFRPEPFVEVTNLPVMDIATYGVVAQVEIQEQHHLGVSDTVQWPLRRPARQSASQFEVDAALAATEVDHLVRVARIRYESPMLVELLLQDGSNLLWGGTAVYAARMVVKALGNPEAIGGWLPALQAAWYEQKDRKWRARLASEQSKREFRQHQAGVAAEVAVFAKIVDEFASTATVASIELDGVDPTVAPLEA